MRQLEQGELLHNRQGDPAAAEHGWLGSRSCFRDVRQPGKLYSRKKHRNMEIENAEV